MKRHKSSSILSNGELLLFVTLLPFISSEMVKCQLTITLFRIIVMSFKDDVFHTVSFTNWPSNMIRIFEVLNKIQQKYYNTLNNYNS